MPMRRSRSGDQQALVMAAASRLEAPGHARLSRRHPGTGSKTHEATRRLLPSAAPQGPRAAELSPIEVHESREPELERRDAARRARA